VLDDPVLPKNGIPLITVGEVGLPIHRLKEAYQMTILNTVLEKVCWTSGCNAY
jgi:hypothetical protein